MEKKTPDQSWKSLNAPAKVEELVIGEEPKTEDTTTSTTGPKKIVV